MVWRNWDGTYSLFFAQAPPWEAALATGLSPDDVDPLIAFLASARIVDFSELFHRDFFTGWLALAKLRLHGAQSAYVTPGGLVFLEERVASWLERHPF